MFCIGGCFIPRAERSFQATLEVLANQRLLLSEPLTAKSDSDPFNFFKKMLTKHSRCTTNRVHLGYEWSQSLCLKNFKGIKSPLCGKCIRDHRNVKGESSALKSNHKYFD